jgi:glycine cleavage system protein P-like pyridoxal-binding family
MKKYHEKRGDTQRTRVLIPDSAHGTNPASAAMVGFTVTHIPSDDKGCVDLNALQAALDDTVAGLMLTNPNTVGIFDPNILEITRLVHEAGGLNYYDGANLNAIMGWVRPGDMGFDVIHLNLHKTFSTPHGGGGHIAGLVNVAGLLGHAGGADHQGAGLTVCQGEAQQGIRIRENERLWHESCYPSCGFVAQKCRRRAFFAGCPRVMSP